MIAGKPIVLLVNSSWIFSDVETSYICSLVMHSVMGDLFPDLSIHLFFFI